MSLKTKIQNYFSTHELSCEDDVDRTLAIKQSFELYKKISQDMEEPEEYLSHMNNDLVKLIGYKIDLVEKKDLEGITLWNEVDQRMYKNDELSEEKIVEFLKEVPISFLISFLGYAAYKERQWL
jgi:hypothetical protein